MRNDNPPKRDSKMGRDWRNVLEELGFNEHRIACLFDTPSPAPHYKSPLGQSLMHMLYHDGFPHHRIAALFDTNSARASEANPPPGGGYKARLLATTAQPLYERPQMSFKMIDAPVPSCA